MVNDNPLTSAERAAIPHQEAVGSLLFAAQVLRPDIQYAVHMVSRFNNNFGRAHWNAVKRILRYIRGTLNMWIKYHRISSYFAYLHQSGAITWNSKRQPTVAPLTTEAEYMAMSTATQKAIWLQQLNNEIFGTHKLLGTVTIFSDNKSSLMLREWSTTFHPRTKHINISSTRKGSRW